jgi:hypothetical protein
MKFKIRNKLKEIAEICIPIMFKREITPIILKKLLN